MLKPLPVGGGRGDGGSQGAGGHGNCQPGLWRRYNTTNTSSPTPMRYPL